MRRSGYRTCRMCTSVATPPAASDNHASQRKRQGRAIPLTVGGECRCRIRSMREKDASIWATLGEAQLAKLGENHLVEQCR
jgi:hypothetical protein